MYGFVVRPGGTYNKGPTVLALHGRTGLDLPFKAMLQLYAAHGYTALAINLYDQDSQGLPQTAKNRMEGDDLESAATQHGNHATLVKINAGINTLFDNFFASTVNLVGWDTGGKKAIQATLNNSSKITSSINFYGSPKDLEFATISRPILNVNLHLDQSIATEDLIELEQSISSPLVQFKRYENVTPGFMEPSINTNFFNFEDDGQTKIHIKVFYDHIRWISERQATP